jgi:uncharacterized protein with von Willebrand factor type A (vWA) domain
LLALRLARFAAVLRGAGIPVGSGEVIDALDALREVEPLDREQTRLALSATMAKDERAHELFNRLFDGFFISPQEAASREMSRTAREELQAAEDRRRMGEGRADLQFMGRQLDLTDEQMATYARLSAAQRERLREFLHRADGDPASLDPALLPLVEHVVREHLERWRRQLAVARRAAPGAIDEQVADSYQGLVAGAGGGDDPLLQLDMQQIPAQDMGRAMALIRKLARRLAARIMRRYRAARRDERIDFRRTIRANYRYGGTLIDLRYRARRLRKPRIVLICDVSGSMAKYSSFTLYFAHGLAKVVSDLRAFLFAEDLEDVTPRLRALAGTPTTLAGLAEGSKVWGKGTNLGIALRRLTDEHDRLLTGNTVFVIVSDTKTLAAAEAAAILARMRTRVRGIIWLNTVPADQWDTLPAVAMLAEHVDMYQCSSLGDLETVLRRAILVGTA